MPRTQVYCIPHQIWVRDSPTKTAESMRTSDEAMAHHGCALTTTCERLYDKELPQDETALRAVIEQLQAHGQILVVVDESGIIGVLPIAVARDCAVTMACLLPQRCASR